MEPKLHELRIRLQEVSDLHAVNALLGWDQSTYMPPGGADARARQLAIVGRLAHEKFTDDAIGHLLDDLRPYEESLPFDSDEASLIRVARREYQRAVQVPAEFMATLLSHTASTYETWTKARPANDFAMVAEPLEHTLELSRQFAAFFPNAEHPADPLIDMSDYGMSAASVRDLFGDLRTQLLPLVQAITAQAPADDSCLKQFFPEDQQLAFGMQVIKQFGYDFERGRQDKSPHPFMTKFSLGDVRITTRTNEHDLSEALFSTLHESGHAMYEQGIRMAYEASPLGGGTSAGVHESQSRLWENLVGRSRRFWEHFYAPLQAQFPEQLGNVSLDTFYKAVNKVERTLIRTDADEVTYNLHVMMRFDFELDMLDGKLSVRDLPEAWWERFKSDFGIVPPNDSDGVLQDVHWYGGVIGGAFQGYTIGNILSAQFFDAAIHAYPGIPNEIGTGTFGTLHGWLRDNLYQHGSKYTAPELIERATGQALSIDPYMCYLRQKYGDLYHV